MQEHRPSRRDECTVEYSPGIAAADVPPLVQVTCPLGAMWDAESAMRTGLRKFLALAPAVWETVPDIGTLNVFYDAEFVDTYGRTSQQHLLTLQLRSETADKIVWENMDPCRVCRAADVCKSHSGERAAFEALCD